MILRNISKNTTLTTDLKECVSFRDRNLGLLDVKNPRSLLFRTRFGIHTFGLKETIDVVVLQNFTPGHPIQSGCHSGPGPGIQAPKGLDPRSWSGMTGPASVLQMKIIKIKVDLKPNRVFFWNPQFSIVVELPKETLAKSNTKTGNILEIIY